MKSATIEELAYLIKEAKEQRLPQPIVFLGAGASKSGGIPLAGEIIQDILKKYKNNPKVKKLKDEDKTYPALMECLTPYERNKLLKEYIDNAKINVTHIYLAQLINQGFIDYVLTVNFDNLMLRALALYNEFPPTYDMAILKDLTTTTFKEKSVLYLHGQHHGLWLLNTSEEMAKVREIIPPILNSIKDRPWIFLGYSGEDPIFNQIIKLGRFDRGLYWVVYQNKNNLEALVQKTLLDKPNTNTFLMEGFDSDSFMLKLNNELGLPQPQIIDKPFSSLKELLKNIVDIDDKEHFKGVKERLGIVQREVDTAIEQFEEGKVKATKKLKEEVDLNLLKKQIIDITIKREFNEEEIKKIEGKIEGLNNTDINNSLSHLYLEWGSELYDKGRKEENIDFYYRSIEKYEKAEELKANDYLIYNNWGTTLYEIGRLKKDENLYVESIEKYERSAGLKPDYHIAYDNWGIALTGLGDLKKDKDLYLKSIEKYKKAIKFRPKDSFIYHNWGSTLAKLANLTKDETYLEEAIEKLKKGVDLGAPTYNLACAYALVKDKKNALDYLEVALEKNQVKIDDVEKDTDWVSYKNDPDFIKILDKYRI